VKPPRFTVRRLMVAVAIVGVASALGVMTWRSSVYRSLAARHSQHEEGMRREVEGLEENLVNAPGRIAKAREAGDAEEEAAWLRGVAQWQEKLTPYRLEIQKSGRLREKYQRAARYPWLPLEPDPPETEDVP
jgi:hypothetical protein